MKSKNKQKDQKKENGKPFPIVAIGASAGGLEAITELLKNLSPTTGMSYVYVQHLDPSHESMLSTILARATKMKVIEAKEAIPIEADNVYVIPANKGLSIVGGVLKLNPRKAKPAIHMPIDQFFISLAEKHKEGAIGVVLSGNATDGTIGLKAIKTAGGITFAQDDSAKFQSMPKSAFAEGAVDMVLSPKEIAKELERLSQKTAILHEMTKEVHDDEPFDSSEDLKIIIQLLKKATSVDFTHYKMATIKRRIIRRLLLYKLETMNDYVKYLRERPNEIMVLYHDLLINVTNFFRDPEAFEFLKKSLLPRLIKSKIANDPLRIWVPACSTGEEAYSIAITVTEVLGDRASTFPVQIFATDLSEISISKARLGLYSRTDLAEMSPKRLQRFFTKVDGSYRVVKSIRDLCIFASHNIFKDPPFSRIDLISCCNLMIYLDLVLQKKIMAIFHYALNSHGYLMLGKSETIGTSTQLFSQLDKKYKVYTKKKDAKVRALFDMNYRLPGVGSEEIQDSRNQLQKVSAPPDLDKLVDKILLTKYIPASVVINHEMEILQFRGTTGLFLEPSPGKASLNLLKMAKQGLAFELKNIIVKSSKSGKIVNKSGIEINYNGDSRMVSIEVMPLPVDDEKLYLVLFDEIPPPLESDMKAIFSKDKQVKQLQEELKTVREDMRTVIEEQEASNEELQSANEEIISSNEELQSINEELETSKEEMESTNEELMTINTELQVRNEQLSEAYEYAEAMFSTIREAVLVLDSELRVKSANRAFYKIFKMQEEEVEGMHIYELSNGQWNFHKLRELLEEVVENNGFFNSIEFQIHFHGVGLKNILLNARSIIQKIHKQQVILLAIEDITEHKEGQRIIAEREAMFRNMADNAPVMLWVAGPDKQQTFMNKTWLEYTHSDIKEELGMGWTRNIHPDDLNDFLGKYDLAFEKAGSSSP